MAEPDASPDSRLIVTRTPLRVSFVGPDVSVQREFDTVVSTILTHSRDARVRANLALTDKPAATF